MPHTRPITSTRHASNNVAHDTSIAEEPFFSQKESSREKITSAPVPFFQKTKNVIQRAVYDDGPRKYETEDFNGGRQRPIKVTGPIEHHKTSGRGSAPKSISLVNPVDNSVTPLLGYDGGHILGLQLGGKDVNYNVVPMLPKFNRDTWRDVEVQLINQNMFAHSGENFKVAIIVDYPDSNALIPSGLTVKGYADVPATKMKKGKRVRTGRIIKEKEVYSVTKEQPRDIETTPQASDDEKDIMMGTKVGATKSWKKALEQRKDYKSDPFLKAIVEKGYLPQSKVREYPDKITDRPNGYLDIMVLSGQLQSDSNFGRGWDFSATQRKLLLQYKMAKGGGVIRSDDPADPHQVLSEKGAANFPEIDHIIPKSMGGSNFFSNARVVSWQLNNKEDRVKDITPYIGIDRIGYPTFTAGDNSDDLQIKGKFVLKKSFLSLGVKIFTSNEAIATTIGITNLSVGKATDVVQQAIALMLKDGTINETKPGTYSFK